MVAPPPVEKLATSKHVLLTTIKLLSEAFFDIMNSIENITAQIFGKLHSVYVRTQWNLFNQILIQSSHNQHIIEIDFLKNEHWHADASSYVFD